MEMESLSEDVGQLFSLFQMFVLYILVVFAD